MAKIKDEIFRFVSMKISTWENHSKENYVHAELACLRRGIGKSPGELPELWGILYDGLPEELSDKKISPTYAEWAIYISLTLYALHSQGNDAGGGKVYKKDESLGEAVAKLIEREDDLDPVRRHFNVFATSADIEECAHYLRGLVQMLRSKDIPLDYPSLAADLYNYQFPDGVSSVRRKWGRDFYQALNRKNKEDKKDEQ